MEKQTYDITRFIQKIVSKYPVTEEGDVCFTDIHVRVAQDTGEVMAFDDSDNEITRVVVENWIGNAMETSLFYDMVHKAFTPIIDECGTDMCIAKPYSYVLENENGEYVSELYIVDDEETTILGTPFMENLSDDLNDFINNLLKEE